MYRLHVYPTDALDAARRRELRAMLEAAYDADFADEDWRHALGGTHVWVEGPGGAPISHGSVVPRTLACDGHVLRVGYVEAVATAAPYRRQGHGTRAMRRLGEVIRAEFALGALSTGSHGFYARLGWERWRGESFVDAPGGRTRTPEDDDGLMVLRTPGSPAIDPAGPVVADWRAGDVW